MNSNTKIVLGSLDSCCTCKHYYTSLCRPDTSTNSIETWANCEEAECMRYPPTFIATAESMLDKDGEFPHLHRVNFQHPSIYAFLPKCGEYSKAKWVKRYIAKQKEAA